MAGPVFGFSSLEADREVNVSTAGHPDALIGITAESSTVDEHTDNKRIEIATIESNTDAIDITSLETADITLSESNELLDLSVQEQANSWSVSASCTTNKASGETDVTITVVDAIGNGVSVHGATRTLEDISVMCGDGDFTADWYEITEKYSGKSSDVTFTIQNVHNESVTVTGIKIDDASNSAESYDVIDLTPADGNGDGIRNAGEYSVGVEESHDSYTIGPGEEVNYRLENFDQKIHSKDVVITILTEEDS